jgi:thioredoxin 2
MSTTDHVSVVSCPSCGSKNRVRAAAPGVPHCGVCGKPLPWLVEAEQTTFHQVVEESPVPVLVDFWAPWCGPCKIVEPVVRQLSNELAGRLKVVRIDTDQAPELGQRFTIRGIPTLMLFDKGEVRDRLTGAVGAPTLRGWLEARLATRQPT